ncbi:helix-turn-helix domain-containing protein [Chitinophaga pinensis]|uniref:Transcriptional regulator, AraC family n=1 Tax=Chitinophaga pinensis (strain ATCC 43595 / DSM 2588 / LMG 13176 / NBRC 15968 / NCIMB 11800 / UQM 2034) TaxID=485918 RepID=A0A979G4N0_CHIPD|nr:helix-turn-helix transcriptional regulator [Chitinophaga pinensis]ACU60623.1 transcriptional regulator, AraC family [Chitinophaga pinensis DSM 2588]
MRLHVHPSNLPDPGIVAKPPPSVRAFIIPWAQIDYRTYSFGSILRQHFRSRHFTIYHFLFDVVKPTLVELHCSQPYVALQFTLVGKCYGKLLGGMNYVAEEGKTILFYLAKGIHNGTIETGRYQSILIQFNLMMLTELAEDMPFLEKLRERLLTLAGKGDQLPPLPISYFMAGVIDKMLKSRLTNGALNLALKTGIFELVGLYNQALTSSEYTTNLPAVQHKDKLVDMYNTILYRPNIRSCKLSVFSQKYFLSQVTLSRYFNQLFQVHVADFVLEQVMKKATWLLLNTDNPIADIAEELGYSSVSNFSRAFTEYSGHSPMQLRRRKE